MHRSLLCLSLLAVLVAAVAAAPNGRKYNDKYDHIDVDAILRNDRILTSYVKCMLDKGPCTAEGKNLKADLPDALQTDCSKCTEKQVEIVRRAAKHLMDKRPADWEKLESKYDPEGKHRDSFLRFLKLETTSA